VVRQIDGLFAGTVPHRQWALRRWFFAHPLWYYHARSDQHDLNGSSQFYQLVDPDLRELCHLLLGAGLQTTPSCQGHFYPRDRFEHIWEELVREERTIRTAGLEVADSATGERFLFRDSAYRLPWSGFDALLGEANAHQNKGYLGLRVPPDRRDVEVRLKRDAYRTAGARIEADEHLGRVFGGALFGIFVEPDSPLQRDREWVDITAYMRGVLGGTLRRDLQPKHNRLRKVECR
jgi:hypothetical protein